MSWGLDFFKDATGESSMGRLLAFASFPPSTYVLLTHPNSEMLGWYVSGYVLGYVGGKLGDALGKPRAANMNVENVESAVVNPPPKPKKR